MNTPTFLKVAFTDVHQTTHEAAILCIKNSQTSGHVSTNMVLNPEKTVYVPEDSNLINTTYSVEYWPSQAAKDNMALPMDLRSANQQIQMTFSRDSSSLSLNDVEAALLDLQEVVLPAIDANATIEVL